MFVREYVAKVQSGEIDVVEHTERVLEESAKLNKEHHFFNTLETSLEQAKKVKKDPSGKLAGLPVSIKDCICVKGMESTAGSRILVGYRPTFDATAVARLKKEGAIIIGKTAQDEFGFGSFSVNVGLDKQVPLNPFDKERSCGGSSGGSGGITQKAPFPHISLGESTGGSIACPGSFCGVTALCPTYGRVSRYGLMDYASSLDKIGPMAKHVEDVALALQVIAGFDEKESTTVNKPVPDYSDLGIKRYTLGVIKETMGAGVDKTVAGEVQSAVDNLEEHGARIKEVSLPLTNTYGVYTYYLLAMAEASTNLAKFCGMRYGKHEKLEGDFNTYFAKVRGKHFGNEAKRRIILGTFARMAGYRDAYYLKATKIRTRIIEEYKRVFKDCDALVSPTMPIVAPKFSDIEKLTPLQHYLMDIMTVGPNVAGLPHLSVPVGSKGKLPIGLMLTGDHLQEKKILQIGKVLENETRF